LKSVSGAPFSGYLSIRSICSSIDVIDEPSVLIFFSRIPEEIHDPPDSVDEYRMARRSRENPGGNLERSRARGLAGPA